MDMYNGKTYELADVSTRFFALLIDSIIVSVVAGIFGISTDFVGGSILGIIFWAGYEWYFLTRHNGQTPGKMLLNLRVVKIDGSPIDDADAILRYMGYLVGSAIIMLGFIWAFFDSNRQGWHDKLAKTYVVKAGEEKRKNTTVTI
ncbi:MAG: RDD family protein [Anaerolineae bacterium]